MRAATLPKTQQLADVAQAGFDASTGTIADAGHHSSGDYSVEFKQPQRWASFTWPQWAFELAKAALLSERCAAAEALEAVTRSGGREGQAEV